MSYSAGILQDMELAIPLWQVGIFISLITLFMLFARLRLCLITTYLFTLFWVFILNKDKFGQTPAEQFFFVSCFVISGFSIAILSLWAFYKDTH